MNFKNLCAFEPLYLCVKKNTRIFLQRSPLTILLMLLILKMLWAITMVLFGPVHLTPDEAQYWTWSQALDFGYYSKPPGVAWQIALGTYLFGNTELGVRFIAIILSTLLPLATYQLALSCHLKAKGALYAALTIAFCPVGLMASFAATTDGGFVLLWTVAFALLLHNPNFLLIGLAVLIGALFKWTMMLFWIPVVIGLLFYPQWRSRQLIYGVLISLLGLLPSIYWNASHDWVTFKHVWTQSSGSSKANPLEFFLSQVGIFFPVFFAFFVLVLGKVRGNLRFCTWTALGILLIYELLSFKQKIQANWAVYAYPLAAVAVGSYVEERKKLWFMVSIGLSVILSLIAMLIPISLFKTSVGWDRLPKALEKVGYNPQEDFLFSDNYQMTSLLSFYSPEQKRAYFLNIAGHRKNQFSFWPTLKEQQLHRKGFFVVTGNVVPEKIESALSPYFSHVHFVEKVVLVSEAKSAFIFECDDYNGKIAKDPDIY